MSDGFSQITSGIPADTVFYGAGNNMRVILNAYRTMGVEFDYPIWDIKAESIGSIDGHKTTFPDFSSNQSGRNAIITIANLDIAEKVACDLRNAGFHIIENPFDMLAGYTDSYTEELNYPIELTTQEIAIVKSIIEQKLTMVNIEGLCATVKACKYVVENNIEGDWVECGVWRGGSSILAAEIFRLLGSKRKIWMFDTFGGFEGIEPCEYDGFNYEFHKRQDKEKAEEDNKRLYVNDGIDDVKNYFQQRGLLDDFAVFVQGDVCQTLDTSELPTKIAILRLDTNLYNSTKKEMEVLYPLLEKSGVIMIDDYGLYTGQKKAVDDYFVGKARPLFTNIGFNIRTGVKI